MKINELKLHDAYSKKTRKLWISTHRFILQLSFPMGHNCLADQTSTLAAHKFTRKGTNVGWFLTFFNQTIIFLMKGALAAAWGLQQMIKDRSSIRLSCSVGVEAGHSVWIGMSLGRGIQKKNADSYSMLTIFYCLRINMLINCII